jgi:hypothetical protein
VALSLLVCFAVDRAVYRELGLDAWLALRAVLTLVAAMALVAGAAAYWAI